MARSLTVVRQGVESPGLNTYYVYDSDDGFHIVQAEGISVLEEGIVLFHVQGDTVHIFVRPISVELAELTLENK